jgi:hypothetical protein
VDALSGDETFRPGTFTQQMDSVPGQVDAGIAKLDEVCSSQGTDWAAEKATVVITDVTETFVAGTFDETFKDGTTLEGTFHVPLCGRFVLETCTP